MNQPTHKKNSSGHFLQKKICSNDRIVGLMSDSKKLEKNFIKKNSRAITLGCCGMELKKIGVWKYIYKMTVGLFIWWGA